MGFLSKIGWLAAIIVIAYLLIPSFKTYADDNIIPEIKDAFKTDETEDREDGSEDLSEVLSDENWEELGRITKEVDCNTDEECQEVYDSNSKCIGGICMKEM